MGVEYILTAEKTENGIRYIPDETLKEKHYEQEELERDARKLLQRNPRRKSVMIKIMEED